MKRLLTKLLVVLIMISMAACQSEMAVDETAPVTDVTDVPFPSETSEYTEPSYVTEPTIEADSLDDYEFIYDDERDRAWEEDVIFLAQTVLGKHPKVFEDVHWVKYSKDWSSGYLPVNIYYDVVLRNELIDQIRELISKIPEISDRAIQYELMRIVALLDDAHSSIYWAKGDRFPISLKVLYVGGDAGIYVVEAPEEYSDLLYTRLVCVNSIPVKEIVYDLMDYVSSENEYLSATEVIDQRSGSFLTWIDSLCAVGVMEEGERTAELSFQDATGQVITLTMDAVTVDEFKEMDMTSGVFTSEAYLDCEDKVQSYYWYTRMEDENTYYLRITQFRDNEAYPFTTFFNDIMLQLYDAEKPQKVIIDLRGNGGGKVLWQMTNDFFGRLDGANTDGIYILLDELSCSASVIMSCLIKQGVDDAVIVGTPAGQPPDFFTGQAYETLPNSGLGFQISACYAVTWKDYEYDALMPDVTVYQTLEDYQLGVDTVLKYVLGQ